MGEILWGGFCNEVRCIMKKENNSAHNHNRGSFSGRIGYVLAVAGSAVGLGNIWRFPYLAAKYGGGNFPADLYSSDCIIGYVLIMSETALGRMTRKSPVGAFEHFGKTKIIQNRRMVKCSDSNADRSLLQYDWRMG